MRPRSEGAARRNVKAEQGEERAGEDQAPNDKPLSDFRSVLSGGSRSDKIYVHFGKYTVAFQAASHRLASAVTALLFSESDEITTLKLHRTAR